MRRLFLLLLLISFLAALAVGCEVTVRGAGGRVVVTQPDPPDTSAREDPDSDSDSSSDSDSDSDSDD